MTNHIEPIPQGAMLASDSQISIRIPGLMLDRLKTIAEQEQRSVNNTIRLALFEWINEMAKRE